LGSAGGLVPKIGTSKAARVRRGGRGIGKHRTGRTAGKEGITKQDVLPAVADVLASLALIIAGEDGTRAAIKRLEGRIEDWKAGTFPAPAITH
jgi:hypothetical protein